jgi:hypothetical protein
MEVFGYPVPGREPKLLNTGSFAEFVLSAGFQAFNAAA